MAVTRVDLSVTLATNDACTNITLTDTTGLYSATNLLGYGVPSGPATTNLTSLSIKLTYSSIGTYITYNFIISSGTITSATLAMGTGTATSILSSLSTTNWYNLMSAGFDLSADYGVTIPSTEDGVYEAEYTIAGSVSGTSFAFTTSCQILNACSACECISRKFMDIDPSCTSCFEPKMILAMTGDAYLKTAGYAVNVGDLDKAVDALTKAQDICSCTCNC